MRCVEAQRLIKPYLEGELPDKELGPFLEHMKSCRDCHEDLEISLAVYSALDSDQDEQVDYNVVRALKRRLEASEQGLRCRYLASLVRRILVMLAQLMLLVCVLSYAYRGWEQNEDARRGQVPAVIIEEETR